MSEIDHFIEEVTEEVRRDRLFALYRKYGWMVALAVVLIVGGAAYNEYRKAQEVAMARMVGDAMVAALSANEAQARAEALSGLVANTPDADAIVRMMEAAAQVEAGNTEAAVAALDRVASDGEVSAIYRDIAMFKALTLQADSLPPEELRQRFSALARPGGALRLLAEEQLALIDIAQGEAQAALERLEAIRQDAEASTALQQRVTRLIIALGGDPAPLPVSGQS